MTYYGTINGEVFFSTASSYDGYDVTSAKVSLELGSAGSAMFGVPPSNIFYGNFNKLVDAVSVYRGDAEIFFGRVYGTSGEFNTVHTVTCEGYLTVLNDSILEPATYECSLDDLVGVLVDNHNAKCPAWPLSVGTLEFSDDYVYRAYENYETTKTRFDDLVDSYGGYLVCRKEDGIVYLDWLDLDNTADEGQTINFGENLLDIVQESTADEIITALIPIGATVTEEAEDGEDTEYTVDISSVNNGLIYIYDEDAVEKYGWIWGTYTWDDVEEPANLYTKAVTYLAEKCKGYVTIEVSAVDLAEAGYDYDAFFIGVKNPVYSAPHGIDDSYLCTALEIDCLDRTSSTMTLGGERVGIVSTSNKNYQSNVRLIEKITANYATNNALSSVAEKVKTNTSLITQLSDLIGLYVSEDTTVGSTVIESLTSSIELTAEEILATVSATYATSDDVSAMIRLTTDGVEVARMEDGAYTSTKTLITDDGMSIVSSDGSLTYMEATSSAVNLYSGGLIGAKIASSGLSVYFSGTLGCSIASNSSYGASITSQSGLLCTALDGQISIYTTASSGHALFGTYGSDADAMIESAYGDIHLDAPNASVYATPYGGGDTLYPVMVGATGSCSYIEASAVTVACAAGEVTSQSVTFTNSFAAIPTVVATPCSTRPDLRSVGVMRTKSGFTLYVNNSGSSDVELTVAWAAIGRISV